MVQSSDNAVMFASMTIRPKPVSAARIMTNSFNEDSATRHLDSLKVSLRNASDIVYKYAQTMGLLSCHVTTGREVTSCNINALLIYISNVILIKNLRISHNILK